MRERGRGAIVNVSSTAGKRPSTGMPNYSVTKAAVLSLSRLVADLYAQRRDPLQRRHAGADGDGARGSARAGWPTSRRRGAARRATRCSRRSAAGRPLGRLARAGGDRRGDRLPLLGRAPAYVTGAAWSADGGTVPIII